MKSCLPSRTHQVSNIYNNRHMMAMQCSYYYLLWLPWQEWNIIMIGLITKTTRPNTFCSSFFSSIYEHHSARKERLQLLAAIYSFSSSVADQLKKEKAG